MRGAAHLQYLFALFSKALQNFRLSRFRDKWENGHLESNFWTNFKTVLKL